MAWDCLALAYPGWKCSKMVPKAFTKWHPKGSQNGPQRFPQNSPEMIPKWSPNCPRDPLKDPKGSWVKTRGFSREFQAHLARSRRARSRSTRAAAPRQAMTPISSCGACAGLGHPLRGHRWPWSHPLPLMSLRGHQEGGSAKGDPKNEGFDPKMAPGVCSNCHQKGGKWPQNGP